MTRQLPRGIRLVVVVDGFVFDLTGGGVVALHLEGA